MASLLEEIWSYEDERVSACVLRRVPDPSGIGELRIEVKNGHLVHLPVPLTPDSPTEEDDLQWFTLVNLYREDV